MKKKIFALLLLGLTAIQVTGCQSTLERLVYFPEEFDYDGYKKIVIENAEFYVPEELEGTGNSSSAVFEDTDYIIKAFNFTESVYADDKEDIAKNIEEYAETKSIDIDIDIDVRNTKDVTVGEIRKIIYSSTDIDGNEGKVAYMAGDGYEVALFAADDDYFEDGQIYVTAKSLTYTDDDDYTFEGKETSTEEDIEERATETSTKPEAESEEETEEETDSSSEHSTNITSHASTDMPDIVADYKAPKALSSDLSKYICEYDGDLYQLPCPVSALVENGWVIDDEDVDVVIDSEDYKVIGLSRDGSNLIAAVTNYADDAVNPEYAFVTDFSDISDEGLVVGKDRIKIGDEATAVEAILNKASGFEVSVDEDSINAYDDNLDGYYFSIEEGKISYVSIQNKMD